MSLRVLLGYKKINFAIFRQIYAADRFIKTAQTPEIRAIRQAIPCINNSCANKTLSGSAIASLLV